MTKSSIVFEVDSSFAKLQNFIYYNEDLTEETKQKILTLCFTCNDAINKIIGEESFK